MQPTPLATTTLTTTVATTVTSHGEEPQLWAPAIANPLMVPNRPVSSGTGAVEVDVNALQLHRNLCDSLRVGALRDHDAWARSGKLAHTQSACAGACRSCGAVIDDSFEAHHRGSPQSPARDGQSGHPQPSSPREQLGMRNPRDLCLSFPIVLLAQVPTTVLCLVLYAHASAPYNMLYVALALCLSVLLLAPLLAEFAGKIAAAAVQDALKKASGAASLAASVGSASPRRSPTALCEDCKKSRSGHGGFDGVLRTGKLQHLASASTELAVVQALRERPGYDSESDGTSLASDDRSTGSMTGPTSTQGGGGGGSATSSALAFASCLRFKTGKVPKSASASTRQAAVLVAGIPMTSAYAVENPEPFLVQYASVLASITDVITRTGGTLHAALGPLVVASFGSSRTRFPHHPAGIAALQLRDIVCSYAAAAAEAAAAVAATPPSPHQSNTSTARLTSPAASFASASLNSASNTTGAPAVDLPPQPAQAPPAAVPAAAASAATALTLNIGVATGTLLCGVMGSDAWKNHTMVGPPLDRALQMQRASVWIGVRVMVDSEVRRGCLDCFLLRFADSILFRDAEVRVTAPAPEKAYELIASKSTSPREWMYYEESDYDRGAKALLSSDFDSAVRLLTSWAQIRAAAGVADPNASRLLALAISHTRPPFTVL